VIGERISVERRSGLNRALDRIDIFDDSWTASIRFHYEGPTKGAQEDPAYVTMGEAYSLSTPSFVLVGTGLFLLSIG